MKVASFIFLVDFMILNFKVDFQVPIILGRPFLATGRVLVDMDLGKIRLRLNDEQVPFNGCQSIQQLDGMKVMSMIDTIDNEVDIVMVLIEKRLLLKH